MEEVRITPGDGLVEKDGYLPVTFEIRATLEAGEDVYVSGSCEELGFFVFAIFKCRR